MPSAAFLDSSIIADGLACLAMPSASAEAEMKLTPCPGVRMSAMVQGR